MREKTDTGSSCLKNEYYFKDGDWNVLETRDWFVLDSLGIDSNVGHVGKLAIPEDRPSRMKVKFELSKPSRKPAPID